MHRFLYFLNCGSSISVSSPHMKREPSRRKKKSGRRAQAGRLVDKQAVRRRSLFVPRSKYRRSSGVNAPILLREQVPDFQPRSVPKGSSLLRERASSRNAAPEGSHVKQRLFVYSPPGVGFLPGLSRQQPSAGALVASIHHILRGSGEKKKKSARAQLLRYSLHLLSRGNEYRAYQ